MAITLDEIKAEHSRLAEMIKAFEAQVPTLFLLREASIELRPGERYAGVLLDDWRAALERAAEAAGED